MTELVKCLSNKQHSPHKFCHSQGAKGQKVNGVGCRMLLFSASGSWKRHLVSKPFTITWLPTKQMSLIKTLVNPCHHPKWGVRANVVWEYKGTGLCLALHSLWHLFCHYENGTGEKTSRMDRGFDELRPVMALAHQPGHLISICDHCTVRTELSLQDTRSHVI